MKIEPTTAKPQHEPARPPGLAQLAAAVKRKHPCWSDQRCLIEAKREWANVNRKG